MENNKKLKLLTVKEVALILEIHPVSVYRLLEKGELKGKKIGRKWFILEDDILNKFEQKNDT